MRLTDWLLFLHVTGAALYVGGGILLNLLAFQARRDGRATELLDTIKTADKGIAVGALVTIITGIGLVLSTEAWTFASGFVLIGIGVVVVSGTTESLYFRKQIETMANLVSEQPNSTEINAHLESITKVATTVNLLLVIAIWAMVFKPGI